MTYNILSIGIAIIGLVLSLIQVFQGRKKETRCSGYDYILSADKTMVEFFDKWGKIFFIFSFVLISLTLVACYFPQESRFHLPYIYFKTSIAIMYIGLAIQTFFNRKVAFYDLGIIKRLYKLRLEKGIFDAFYMTPVCLMILVFMVVEVLDYFFNLIHLSSLLIFVFVLSSIYLLSIYSSYLKTYFHIRVLYAVDKMTIIGELGCKNIIYDYYRSDDMINTIQIKNKKPIVVLYPIDKVTFEKEIDISRRLIDDYKSHQYNATGEVKIVNNEEGDGYSRLDA